MKKLLYLLTAILTILTSFNINAQENNMTGKKALVAYFSATGNTAALAQRLAGAINADLFEIKPQKPYSAADLDWQNDQSRSSLEMKDTSSRPEIASKLADINQYNVIFVGFPIWWYREPSIIDTFMESYDFSGKKIIPFATSGSSGIGNSGGNMQKLAPLAEVANGKRFSTSATETELKTWAQDWL